MSTDIEGPYKYMNKPLVTTLQHSIPTPQPQPQPQPTVGHVRISPLFLPLNVPIRSPKALDLQVLNGDNRKGTG